MVDDVSYHDQDFNWEDLAEECKDEVNNHIFPADAQNQLDSLAKESQFNWDRFHRCHKGVFSIVFVAAVTTTVYEDGIFI